jgi:hypothetical protein
VDVSSFSNKQDLLTIEGNKNSQNMFGAIKVKYRTPSENLMVVRLLCLKI